MQSNLKNAQKTISCIALETVIVILVSILLEVAANKLSQVQLPRVASSRVILLSNKRFIIALSMENTNNSLQ